MKNKFLFATLSLATAMSLNAAVLATVNNAEITDKDVAFVLGAMPGVEFGQLPKDTQKKVIDEAIGRKLLTDEAMKSGVEKEDEFKKMLEEVKANITLDLWMKKIFNNIKVTDNEINDFYNKNKANFAVPAITKARHILVADEKTANDIIAQLKGLKGDALIQKFAELAKSKSIDQGSAVNGGDLGWFDQSQMVKPFTDASFALKNGEFSAKPVKTNFGYHVILKEDFKPSRTKSVAEAKPEIEYGLKMEKFRAEMKKRSDELRSKAKIEYK
ncbi:MAG: peptidylprolyl isomerase [Campylobacter sp.]